MAGIKAPIQDILTRLATISPVDQDNSANPLYARVWNNQLKQLTSGETYSFPRPCAFLELPNPTQYNRLLNAIDEADVVFRVHIAHDYYDAEDGTFEQDLTIFDLRDQIVALLSQYSPTGCGTMVRIAEEQDYSHTNIYHYIIDFKCAFIDSKGSPFDSASNAYTESVPPTRLNINIEVEGKGTNHLIPQQPYRIQN